MRERPILFSGAMVRALLAGTKTQTRRAIKPQPTFTDGHYGWKHKKTVFSNWRTAAAFAEALSKCCPYGQPGDRLWVRETWAAALRLNNVPPSALHVGDTKLHYAANYPNKSHFVWRPSIHMCRWMSRILVEITAVRCERLQDISEADAVAEGIERKQDGGFTIYPSYETGLVVANARYSYQTLWKKINGADSWKANPWVWVVEFKRVE